MPAEFGATDLLLAFLLGALFVYMYWTSTRKKWFLESMSPRNHYELGREKKLLVNMTIHNKSFNGLKAGKYTVFLTHGSLSEYSKAIFFGKIEHIYSSVLAESLVAKKLLRPIEEKTFLSFVFQRLPELTVKNHLITGELVPPDHILECWEEKGDKDKAWADLRRRKLISPNVLWVKPYPPENKLKEIMSGLVQIPHILEENMKDVEGLTASYRETVIQVNQSVSSMLKEFIPLARLIVTSISDPTFVMALIITDRAQQIRGLGISQLSERGGMEGILEAARQLTRKRDEFLKILGTPLTKEETERIQNLEKAVSRIEEMLKGFEKKPAPPPLAGPSGAK